MKRVGMMTMAAAALLLAGCALMPERAAPIVPPQLFEDSAFGQPSHRIDASDVFALSPAMKRYLEVDIAPQLRTMGRQRGLVQALYSKAQLRLDYESEYTRNAAEAFAARSGNCLSLVVMSAALAKQLDLRLQYQALVGEETWTRSADLSIVSGHVNLAIDKRLVDRVIGAESATTLQLSFGTTAAGRGALFREVSEATIVAMFMNNRAAESLVRGQMDDAYAYAREAIVQDPLYAAGYNTLAVIYQRKGLDAPAERAFRTALERQAVNRPALRNLAKLYETQGRHADAAPLYQRLARIEKDAPFQHFDLARAAIAAGDYRAGRDHILREMKRDPDYHEFHFWLAMALAGLGDVAGAREHLALAKNNSTTRREHAIYAGKLERLQAVTRAN